LNMEKVMPGQIPCQANASRFLSPGVLYQRTDGRHFTVICGFAFGAEV